MAAIIPEITPTKPIPIGFRKSDQIRLMINCKDRIPKEERNILKYILDRRLTGEKPLNVNLLFNACKRWPDKMVKTANRNKQIKIRRTAYKYFAA
ncbi:hypothetical protein D3C86_1656640 [compost metagenome]